MNGVHGNRLQHICSCHWCVQNRMKLPLLQSYTACLKGSKHLRNDMGQCLEEEKKILRDRISKEFSHDKGSAVYWIIQLDNSATWEGHKLEAIRTTGPPYQTTLILTRSPLWTKRTLILCSCEPCPAPLQYHYCELHLLKLPPLSQSVCNQFTYNLVINIFQTGYSYSEYTELPRPLLVIHHMLY